MELRDFRDVVDVLERSPVDDKRREQLKDSPLAYIHMLAIDVDRGGITQAEAERKYEAFLTALSERS